MYSPVPEHNTIRLDVDFMYEYKGLQYWIPAGFEFDGASIPRFFWTVLGYGPFHPDLYEASKKHDWAFLTQCLSFREANAEFKRDLKKAGVRKPKYLLMWSMVNTFGYYYYKKTDKKNIESLKKILAEREDREKFLQYVKTFKM